MKVNGRNSFILFGSMFNSYVMMLFFFAIISGSSMMVGFRLLSAYSPYLVTGIAGLITGISGLIVWWFVGGKGQSFPQFHRAMLLLGISILGLNAAYSLIYATKIPTAYAPIIVTAGMTIVLGMVGWFLFRESIGWNFVIGALLICAGLLVIVRG